MPSKQERFASWGAGAVLILVVALAAAGCAPAAQEPIEPPDTRPVDEAAIRGLIQDWSAASAAKDAEAFSAVYADDGTVMLEGVPDMHGKQAILEGVAHMMEDPNFDLSFEPTDIFVARAGDLAYEYGNYSLTMTGDGGEAMTGTGSYVVIWKKQADGTWKVMFDVPVSV